LALLRVLCSERVYYLAGHGVPRSLIDRTYEAAARFHPSRGQPRRIGLPRLANNFGLETKRAVGARLPAASPLSGNRRFESISLQRRVGCELPGDGNQVDREAFVDQKPHDTAMVSRPRRVR
jgi:hypothetical protein